MADTDSGYKLLFSHPKLVEDLLRGFVPEPWVADVDFATLTQVKASYVSDNLRQRHDDLVWKVRLKNQWLYVYVLFEFQSQPDPYMALRLLVYVGLLYQDLLREDKLLDGRLPPVLPLVLYHGDKPWTEASDFSNLLTPIPLGLERYQPRFQYLVMDEQNYPKTALTEKNNLAAALFRLNRSRTREELETVVNDLLQWLKLPTQRSLRRTFGIWLQRVFLRRRLKGVIIPEIDDLLEVKSMLAQRWDDWTEEWKQQGIKKGIEQGLQKGEARILIKQLQQRFGMLPPKVIERLEVASCTELDKWAERIFSATSLEALLED